MEFENDDQDKDKRTLKITGKVQEVVFKWVREGTNWLGI